jgi:23S rRNA (uracil1939-C5)-methyltransferase
MTVKRAAEEALLVIDSVGVRGDGVARHDGGPVYVPFAAPGDRVRVRLGAARGEGRVAELVELVKPGARTSPVCPHFGTCGGCALQHLAEDAYIAAKMTQVAGALRQHGVVAAEMAPLLRMPPGTRRRARFALQRPRDKALPALVGFKARASHRIVDMQHCAVLHPALLALAGALRGAVRAFWPPGAAGAATATWSDSGIDLLLDLGAAPDLAMLEALSAFAEAQDLARLAWRAPDVAMPTPAAIRRPPRVVFSGVPVDLPAEAFLQASVEAETALAAEVLAGIGPARRVVDLYAGLGTFSFALAKGAAVHAVDGSPEAVAALAAAAARSGLQRLVGECRDLEERPLRPEELRRFDAAVFDPPRAGAKAQAAALAGSSLRRVVAVSCNPASFARDARLLAEGGFRLLRVQPIDQFLWSPHVELVARFERAGESAPPSQGEFNLRQAP